jgi:SARP family transcriptional regulator, regulator of embCAB operon
VKGGRWHAGGLLSTTALGALGMGKIEVRLLGTTTVVLSNGSTLTELGGIKPRQILEMLASSVGTPISKDRLVEQLWGDNAPRTYNATLESYISMLRRRMGGSRGRRSPLATTSTGYLLDPNQVRVDVDEFRQLVQPDVRLSPELALGRTEQAIRLVNGDLLASEPYAEWAVDERSRFTSEYLQACNGAATHALEISRPHVAVEMARRAVGVEAMSETSWQLLIRGLAATGARSEALRAYLDLRRTLVDALGTEPSPVSRELYLALLAEDDQATRSATTVNEVRTLLDLLHDALDGFPEADLSARDRRVTDQAERLVHAA